MHRFSSVCDGVNLKHDGNYVLVHDGDRDEHSEGNDHGVVIQEKASKGPSADAETNKRKEYGSRSDDPYCCLGCIGK